MFNKLYHLLLAYNALLSRFKVIIPQLDFILHPPLGSLNKSYSFYAILFLAEF